MSVTWQPRLQLEQRVGRQRVFKLPQGVLMRPGAQVHRFSGPYDCLPVHDER